jgi:hypothetical protein
MTIEGIIPEQMAILMVGVIQTKTDKTKITNAIRGGISLTLEIMGIADLTINKDRQMTITIPLGEMEISKIITPKTEGFTHKKAGLKVLLWIENKCHKGIITDRHLLDPNTDKQTQEEIGVDKTTLILKTQGFTHKEEAHMTIPLRGIHTITLSHTQSDNSVGGADSMKVNIPETKNEASKTEKPHCGIGNEGFQTIHPTALLTSIDGTQTGKVEEPVKEESKSQKCCNCKCQIQNTDLETKETEIGVQETIRVVKTPLEEVKKEEMKKRRKKSPR